MVYDLSRLVAAQATTWPQALAELRAGTKRSHWMWWIFPQIAGLGFSDTARYYAIGSPEEACAYLAHPVLAPRLIEATTAVIAARGSARAIMGDVDAIKLRSSMTLFEAAALRSPEVDPTPFRAALDRFFGGERDAATLALLSGQAI